MFGLLRGRRKDAEIPPQREPAPETIGVHGAADFAFAGVLKDVDGFAIPDWNAVYDWLETLPGDELQVRGWLAAEHAWLLHLRDRLGSAYHLDETEGSVNTEHRIVPPGMPLFTPAEMQAKHGRFWGEAELEQFWSGESFSRADDGNMLSYDLARMLVDHLSADWHAFTAFVNAANREDGGIPAARTHLNIDLDQTVSAWLTP